MEGAPCLFCFGYKGFFVAMMLFSDEKRGGYFLK